LAIEDVWCRVDASNCRAEGFQCRKGGVDDLLRGLLPDTPEALLPTTSKNSVLVCGSRDGPQAVRQEPPPGSRRQLTRDDGPDVSLIGAGCAVARECYGET
jgi:hypothetical protein